MEDCHFVDRKPAPSGYIPKYIGNYKSDYLHRIIYETVVGDIPKGC